MRIWQDFKRFYLTSVFVVAVGVTFPGSAQSTPRVEAAEEVLKGACLADYRSRYKRLGKRKAFAVARDNSGRQVCSWRRTEMTGGPADYAALESCEKRKAKSKIKGKCVVVDSDGRLVVKQGALPPLQLPGYEFLIGKEYVELHDRALAVLEGRTCQRRFRRYLLYGGQKAFAYTVSDTGAYAVCAFYTKDFPGQAEKLALNKCNEKREKNIYAKKFTPVCKLFAVNNEVLLNREDFDMASYAPDSLTAARRLHLNTIRAFVARGEDINQVDQRGRTALFYAVETNRIDVVQFLVHNGADVNLPSNRGDTPLAIANKRKFREVAAYLKRNGASESAPVALIATDEPIDVDIDSLRPVKPTMSLQTAMTDAHVGQFVESLPLATQFLSSMQKKFESNAAVREKLSGAVADGEVFRTAVALAQNINAVDGLESAVKKARFQSIEDWAYIGDRIFNVVLITESISMIASGLHEADGFVRGMNIVDYIADEARPEALRDKLREQLNSRCEKECLVPADLPVVSRRLSELREAFQ